MLLQKAQEFLLKLLDQFHVLRTVNQLKEGKPERAMATTRQFSLPECFWDHLLRTSAFTQMGHLQQARNSMQQARQLRPELSERPRELISMIVHEPEVQDRILDTMEVAG